MKPREINNLRLVTPRLTLTASADRLDELVGVAASGIHDPAVQPFGDAWTDCTPDELRERFPAWWQATDEKWSVDDWDLRFVVAHEDDVIGVQSMQGRQFPMLREVRTGSWLGRDYQGHGFGTEMRAAVLELAFRRLGALYARTSAMQGNKRVQAVNAKLRYGPNGTRRVAVRGEPVVEVHYELPFHRWVLYRDQNGFPVEIHGFDASLFGVKDAEA